MTDAAAHERRARLREGWAAGLMVLAVLPALAAPASGAAWLAVGIAVALAAVTLIFLFTGQAQRARSTVALTAAALIGAQIIHSPLILHDAGDFVRRAVLLVALPTPVLIGAYVLASGAADARRLAWGRSYQDKVGYEPKRPDPTMDWRR